MPKLTRIILAAAVAVAVTSAQAGSVAGFGGSTEVTQILNNVELINQSAQMYEQVQNTIKQVQYMEQQLKNLTAAPQMIWGQAQADLQQLAQLVAKGQALGYALSNIDQQFASKYPAYNGVALRNNFQGASKTWTQTSLDSLKAALSTAGLQSNQFATEQAAMDSIQNIAAGAPGQLQATQAGVMVAGQQVQQLQKLRQLFMAQMQAQNAFMAQQTTAQQAEVDTANSHFTKYTPGSGSTFSSSGGKN
jgi:type IV secretion system protein TrbJ